MLTEKDREGLRERWIETAKRCGVFPIELKPDEVTTNDLAGFWGCSRDTAQRRVERLIELDKAELVHSGVKIVGQGRQPRSVYRLKD